MAIEIVQPNLLIVEGEEERYFFKAFIRYLALQDIQVIPIGGTNIRQNLKALVMTPGFMEVTSLGIVRDANSNPENAFRSIYFALQEVKLPTPEQPLEFIGDNPQVGVMILPGGNLPGMLEDLCLKSVEQDPAKLCVNQYFECLQQQGLSLPSNMSKAKVQVFLASRRRAERLLGVAVQKGFIPLGNQAFDEVRHFLQKVCL